MTLSETQIKHMVTRFLQWRLPENFSPDAGINFKKTFNENSQFGPMEHKPIGTNLFDAIQATAMVQHMAKEMPAFLPDGPEEAEIDRLRLAAFQTNSNEDKAAYYLAVSKWFQDRHYRVDEDDCYCGGTTTMHRTGCPESHLEVSEKEIQSLDTPPRSSGKDMQAACDRINERHAVGDLIHCWTGPREGEPIERKIQYPACVMGGHTAVVYVYGVGSIALTHVKEVPTE